MKRHFQCAADPSMIRPWNRQSATRLASEVTFHAHHEHFVLKNTTFRAPAIIPNFTEYCACHEKWHSNFTKYCPCQAKWLSWSILFTHETLFTMRGVTSVIVQLHQILLLPRKMNLMIDPWHKWNVIYNARSNMRHSPNSPNTAPATKNDRPESQRNLLKTEETSFPMRGRSEHDPTMIRPWNRQSATRLASEVTFHAHHEHFVLKNTTFRAPAIIPNFTEYCACHEKWHSNFTKYCACHAKWLSWSILFTHATLFTMRGVTSVIVQLHQILRLPRKMNLMIDPWHKWNVIYNARSNMRHSPNQTHQILRLPRKMTVQNLKEICWKRMKRHFQCAADPTMIRPWNRQSATRLATEVTFHAHHERFVLKNTTFRAPAIIPNFTEYCACHEKWHLNFTKYCACHEKWHLHFTKYCACHEKVTLPAPARKIELLLDWAMTRLSYDVTELLLDWAVTWLSCDLTELWLDWAMTWLSYDLTELWLDWAMTWLSCDLTELWLDWAVTWLSYDVTELLLDWAVTWLSCDLTELWLDWAVTWLSCDLTELWRDWAVTWLSYDLTELWLDWAVTWLSCDLTELWRDWAVTWLNCDLTELWLDWALTWLSCDLTELWLDWAVTWLSCDLTELWLDWAEMRCRSYIGSFST